MVRLSVGCGRYRHARERLDQRLGVEVAGGLAVSSDCFAAVAAASPIM